MKKAILIGLLLSGNNLIAQAQQLPSVSITQPTMMQPGRSTDFSSRPTMPGIPFQNNKHPVQQETYHSGETNARNQAIMQSIEEDAAYFRKMERDQITLRHLIYKGFPSWKDSPGTDHFFNAYKELDAMLRDSIPLNLERAVFLVENAFLENSMKFSDFKEAINQKMKYCQWRMNDLKLDSNDGLAKNMVIFSLLTDTLQIKQPGTEKTVTHYPLNYNLEDYDSHKEYTSHFVTTLLKTNVGQCYSMPLLYLIMAERLGAEAYLALAPIHALVKIKDDQGAWFNLELTSRAILSDYHYMNNSYIKSEAIRNNLYLNALTPKQTIALLFTTLGRYYRDKYGYDPFILECAEQALKYIPASVDARIMESNYQARLTLEIARLIGARNPEELQQASPGAYKQYERMIRLYKELDDSGYEEMPREIYERWLRYVSRLKADEQKESQPALSKVTH